MRWNFNKWEKEFEFSSDKLNDDFAESVYINGNQAIVGAPHNMQEGCVYIFRFDGKKWKNEEKIERNYGRFGQSVAIKDNKVIVGATEAKIIK